MSEKVLEGLKVAVINSPHACNGEKKDQVENIFSRLSKTFAPNVAVIWLHSHNSYLSGRPIDALCLGHLDDVDYALFAQEQDAYM